MSDASMMSDTAFEEEWVKCENVCREASVLFCHSGDVSYGSYMRQIFIMQLVSAGLLSVDAARGKVYTRQNISNEFDEAKPYLTNRDYLSFTFNTRINNKQITLHFGVHEIIVYASRFVPIPYRHVIHHINGDKTDNRLSNLAVMTRDEHQNEHNLRRQLVEFTKITMSGDDVNNYAPLIAKRRRVIFIALAYLYTHPRHNRFCVAPVKEFLKSRYGVSNRQLESILSKQRTRCSSVSEEDFAEFESLRGDLDNLIESGWNKYLPESLRNRVYRKKVRPFHTFNGFTGLEYCPEIKAYFIEKGYLQDAGEEQLTA